MSPKIWRYGQSARQHVNRPIPTEIDNVVNSVDHLESILHLNLSYNNLVGTEILCNMMQDCRRLNRPWQWCTNMKSWQVDMLTKHWSSSTHGWRWGWAHLFCSPLQLSLLSLDSTTELTSFAISVPWRACCAVNIRLQHLLSAIVPSQLASPAITSHGCSCLLPFSCFAIKIQRYRFTMSSDPMLKIHHETMWQSSFPSAV